MPRGEVDLRPARVADAPAIVAIYNREITESTSTFDTVERTLEAQQRWVAERSGAFSAIVAVVDGDVVGFAALSPYKERAAYRTTVENSVYVAPSQHRTGIGRALMEELITTARASGFHSIIARVEASRDGSLALHRACGFELVGVERQVGRKFNRWLDVAILQLLIS